MDRAGVCRILLLIMFCTDAAYSGQPFDTKGYEWEQAIMGEQLHGFTLVPLGAPVLDKSQPSLHDLRILDSNNSLVPHILVRPSEHENQTAEQRDVQLINQTYEPGQYTRVVLDFSRPVSKNRVGVELSGTNFRRKALLEGSTDTLTWETVADNLWLFKVNLPGKEFRAETLHFPRNNFRYLRLTVFHMADDPERIEIQRVAVTMAPAPRPPKGEKVSLSPHARVEDPDTKQTRWSFDLGWRNLPLTALSFRFRDSYFYRGFELYGRNATTETVRTRTEAGERLDTREAPWQLLRSGVLFRIAEATTTTENLQLDTLGPVPRYLQLRMFNLDNPPLHLQEAVASVVLPKLIFHAEKGKDYRLVYGNQSIGAPQYDLGRSAGKLIPAELPSAELGAQRALLEHHEQVPWSERNSRWLLLLLVVAAAGLAAVLVSSLRRLPNPKE